MFNVRLPQFIRNAGAHFGRIIPFIKSLPHAAIGSDSFKPAPANTLSKVPPRRWHSFWRSAPTFPEKEAAHISAGDTVSALFSMGQRDEESLRWIVNQLESLNARQPSGRHYIYSLNRAQLKHPDLWKGHSRELYHVINYFFDKSLAFRRYSDLYRQIEDRAITPEHVSLMHQLKMVGSEQEMEVLFGSHVDVMFDHMIDYPEGFKHHVEYVLNVRDSLEKIRKSVFYPDQYSLKDAPRAYTLPDVKKSVTASQLSQAFAENRDSFDNCEKLVLILTSYIIYGDLRGLDVVYPVDTGLPIDQFMRRKILKSTLFSGPTS